MKFFGTGKAKPKRTVTVEYYSKGYITTSQLDINKPDWFAFIKPGDRKNFHNPNFEKQVKINGIILAYIAEKEKKGTYIDLLFKMYNIHFTEVAFIYKDTVIKTLDLVKLESIKIDDCEDYIRESLDLTLMKLLK